jgi:hypothetical protein
VAVYAEATPRGLEPRAAAEQGFEGVACVDDAARAAILYCHIWRRSRAKWARANAEGLLRFVSSMQGGDGRVANFILDWDGSQNLTGSSSIPGGWAWQSRAMHAFAVGFATFRDDEHRDRFEHGLSWIDRASPYLDTTAECALATLEMWTATSDDRFARRALSWCESIAASQVGGVLPDVAGQRQVHLWGHLQEIALARVGTAFRRPDLVARAAQSARTVFVPHVARAFGGQRTLPFEVSCAARALQAVARSTGDARFARHAELAREWFSGRNAAGRPVYDRARGVVYDGIDDGRLSANSGAESNIEAGLMLIDARTR